MRIKYKTWTPLILVLTITGLWLYDLFPFMNDPCYTISGVLNSYFYYTAHPLMTFLVGFAFGIILNHLLGWGSIDPKQLKQMLTKANEEGKIQDIINKL